MARTTCTRCGARVQLDRAVSYFHVDARPDEAFCRSCHREILGVRECGHDGEGEGPCPACRADREAERQLARQERKDANRREAARVAARSRWAGRRHQAQAPA